MMIFSPRPLGDNMADVVAVFAAASVRKARPRAFSSQSDILDHTLGLLLFTARCLLFYIGFV